MSYSLTDTVLWTFGKAASDHLRHHPAEEVLPGGRQFGDVIYEHAASHRNEP